jgi:hypothetical protein
VGESIATAHHGLKEPSSQSAASRKFSFWTFCTANGEFSIQPFLPISEQDTLWEEIQQFIELCYQQRQQTPAGEARDEAVKSFTQQRDNIRQRLNRNLFSGLK